MPVSVKQHGFARSRLRRDGFEALSIQIHVEDQRGHSDQLLPGVAQALAGGPVHINDASLFEVQHEEGVRRVVHEHTEERLTLAQRLLGALAFRNVERSAEQLNDISRTIQDRVPDRVNMFDRSVGQPDPVLAVAIHPFAYRLLKTRIHLAPILWEHPSKNFFPGR